jgi:phosphoribosylformylglycinamidine synthase subunit PurQ / glutaminase
MKALVLTGDGINCERDTARAFALAGMDSKIMHINDVLANPRQLQDYKALALPGGFSFGDDLGSGQVLALKLSTGLESELREFIAKKRPIIGICNGFQALTKLGLLPQPFAPRTMALARNTSGHFINRWVELEWEKNTKCIWTQGMDKEEKILMPIRHGEGRIVFAQNEEENLHRQLNNNGQIPFRYTHDVNGSYGRIAGVCDPTGVVFGLMPHPEAAISRLQYPRSTSMPDRMAPGVGVKIFENCRNYIKESGV